MFFEPTGIIFPEQSFDENFFWRQKLFTVLCVIIKEKEEEKKKEETGGTTMLPLYGLWS